MPARFAFALNSVGDINGDGLADFGAGTGRQNVDGNAGQGRYYVFDGRTGNLEYRIDNPEPQPSARFGDYASSAGDFTRDGVPDIMISAVAQDFPAGCGTEDPRPADCRENEGVTYVFDGRDGSLVQTFRIPEEDRASPDCHEQIQEGGANFNVCGQNGFASRGVPDMTGDGVPEAMVPASSLRPDGDQTRQGRIYIFDGANAEVLSKIDQPVGDDPDALWGFNETGPLMPGDLNGDGIAEIYGTGIRVDGPNDEFNAGRVWIFDGRESLRQERGVVLFELQNPSVEPIEAFGFSADKTDYNKDGTPDLYVGQLGGSSGGESFIFDGRDGSLLKTLAVPADQRQPGGVITKAPRDPFNEDTLSDLNGDCEPDYVMGRPQQDVRGTENAGRVFFFLSSGPSACPPPPPPAPAPVPPPVAPVVNPCGVPDAAGYLHPAKIRVSRAQVLRSDRRLDVFAPITSRARGAEVQVTYQGDNRSDTFEATVTAGGGALDQIRFKEPITRGQAALGTGIVNLEYQGDPDTRPEFVRLRAASQRAELDVEEISLIDDRLSAEGS
ncbi:MAG: integrin alpha, partial [Actinomycetota bacterium]|nr:integrin alpha [Actinomycetota bacterium]